MTLEIPEELSARELEILRLVATGATNQQIAQELAISINTVKAHLRNVFAKLMVESRTEATLYAIQHGLIEVAAPAEDDASVGAASATEQDDAAAPEAGHEPAPGRETPVIPSPHTLAWPVALSQRIALVVGALLVVAVAAWPQAQANATPTNNRFIDQPIQVSASAKAEALSRWQTVAQISTPRSRFAQAELNGIIYVFSGLTEEGWTPFVEALDTHTNQWERRANKPTAVANVGAAVVDGLIYVPGGYDANNSVRDILEVYDPQQDQWATAAPMPRPICNYAIAPVKGGFYLFGGWDGNTYLDTVYYYDAATDTWHEKPSLAVARGDIAAATVGSRIYLIGGYDGATEYDLCISYDLELEAAGQDPWRTHAPMSVGRAGHSVAASEGTLYVVGGGWDSYLSYSERYDIANDLWSTFESPIVGEWRTLGLSAVGNGNGLMLYALGGWNGGYLGAVQVYQAAPFRVYLPLP
ncbi:MAG: hypothetical protein GX552_01630 [Chloroflexi bacterium]|jgi:DNA-binding CsgD family transcriptional regulator/N-acetylneuraminic acid mutarotase|nr:hypothetical protein [Chloroflexota bacterium]